MANSAGKLEVEIGANITDLTGKLKQATSEISKFDSQGGRSLQSFAKGSNQAAFALTNLGRVAQDAPFGFIGIQNNINPLLESFQRLKQETGSTGSALKALGTSLIGPAGLGIALSVVSSAILLYQQYQQRAKGATDNAKKSSDDYISSLNQQTQAQLKGAQNATKELATLQVLFSAYQDANLPLKQRKEAYSQLQSQYPAYFGNLAFEENVSKKVKSAYDSLTDAIIATGRARAAVDLIAKNQTRALENEQKIVDLEKEQIKNRVDLAKAKKREQSSESIVGGGTAAGFGNVSTLQQLNTAASKLANTQKIINDLKTDTNRLEERNKLLVVSVIAEVKKGAKVTGDIGGSALKPAKIQFDRAGIDGLKAVYTDLATSIGLSTAKINTTNLIPFETALANMSASVAGFKTLTQIQLEELNTGISDILTGSLAPALAGIGEAIGSALANGTSVASSLGKVLLSTLGGVLGQLGQLAIATGITLGAIKKAIQSLNPVVAIAAGVALLALSGVVKGQAAKIGGGIGGGGGSTSVASPPSPYSPSTQSTGGSSVSGGGTVVFEISGTNLIGVLNRSGAELKRYGG